MKKTLFALLLAVAPAVSAYEPDRVFNTEFELVGWCKMEAEQRYIAKNITPYQWSASYHNSSNVLYVDGRLRVHDEDITVRCRAARGARERYAIIEIDDPLLQAQP